MPIYEYQCSACGHQLEAIQKMSDEALVNCPICQKATLLKLISAAGFQLKGTGWYATDFRNKGKPEAPAPKKESETTSSSGEDKKSSSNSTSGGTTKS